MSVSTVKSVLVGVCISLLAFSAEAQVNFSQPPALPGSAYSSGGGGSAPCTEFGTTAGTCAQGNDSRITGALQSSNNLSDVSNVGTSRHNLTLGTADSPSFTGLTVSGISGSTQCLQVNSSGVLAGSGAGCGGAGVSSFNTRTGAVTLQTSDVSGVGGLLSSNNLSDLASASTAATNLGLGTTNTPAFKGTSLSDAIQFSGNTTTTPSKTGIGSLSSSDLSIYTSSIRNFSFSGTILYLLGSSPSINLDSNTAPQINFGASNDVVLTRDGAGILAHRNGTNPQIDRIYATYTDTSDGAWAMIDAGKTTSGVLAIGGRYNGTGVGALTKLELDINNANVADYSETASSIWTMGGGVSTPSVIATSSPATVSAGQISYSGTTAAASNCGTLVGAVGCVEVNVAGTLHYMPYY